jgi:hypothetical protein
MLAFMARAPVKGASARKSTAGKPASAKSRPALARKAPGKPAARKAPAKKAIPASAPETPKPKQPAPARKPLTAAERDRRFNLILQTACLKAGSAAAITAISAKVPLLGRLAPALVGSVTEAMALGRIHQQLVRDILDLYDLDLSELEERGVILLATAANLGAQQLSKQMVDQIIRQLSGRYLGAITARMLPLASLVTEIAASIASTYAVGKRAQVLCNLPGSGARNLSELLRGLTGIDQRRLLSWSGEALKLALAPFRGILSLRAGRR